MSPEPLVSIVIANWNGGEVFKRCLISLNKMSYKNWELILIDNGSNDGSELIADKIITKKILLIKNKTNKGFAFANNQGAKKSNGKYLLLLNNDTIVTSKFLFILVKKMEDDKNVGVIQPKILLLDKKGYLDNTGSFITRIGFLKHKGFLEKDVGQYDDEMEVFSIKGACILIRKEVIEKVGLFDNDFFSYFEESDFCWRVWLGGYKVIYYPKANIYHKVGFTIKRLNVLDINYHYYKNRICSLIKNLEIRNIVMILPLHLLISLGLAIIFFIKGKLNNSFLIFRAIDWNIKNLNRTFAKRKKIQGERMISDSFIFNKLSININWWEFYRDFKRVEKDLKN